MADTILDDAFGGDPDPCFGVQLCSGHGQWHSPNNKKDPRDYLSITLPEIVAMMESPPSVKKEVSKWVIFSSLPSRVHAEQREKGQFYALWANIDETEGMTFDGIVERANGCLLDFMAYTSRNATEKKQKSRIIVPLSEPVIGKRFILLQKILNDKLEKEEIKPDRATERAGQVCYLPNRGKYYRHHIESTAGPMRSSAWDDEIKQEQVRIEAAERAAKARIEQARVKAAKRMQLGCKSPIDAYNAEFSLEMVLEGYGYAPRGRRYLSPNSGSGVPGVTLTNDGRKWLSTHGSDSAIGTPTRNGTMGDAFDLFIYYEHHGDRDAAIRAAGEMFGLSRGYRQRSGEPPPWSDAHYQECADSLGREDDRNHQSHSDGGESEEWPDPVPLFDDIHIGDATWSPKGSRPNGISDFKKNATCMTSNAVDMMPYPNRRRRTPRHHGNPYNNV